MKDSNLANPQCPDHGDLAIRLVLGDLDHDEARQAETTLRKCEPCELWWGSIESSESFQDVEKGVLTGLAGFTPTPRRAKSWLSEVAIAASIVALAVGIPIIASQYQSSVEPIALELSPTATEESTDGTRVAASDEVISSNGFENDSATSWRLGPN